MLCAVSSCCYVQPLYLVTLPPCPALVARFASATRPGLPGLPGMADIIRCNRQALQCALLHNLAQYNPLQNMHLAQCRPLQPRLAALPGQFARFWLPARPASNYTCSYPPRTPSRVVGGSGAPSRCSNSSRPAIRMP